MRLVLAITLAFAAPAQAGTVTLEESRSDRWYLFTAAPGERNAIVVERVPGAGVRITDGAGPPQAGVCRADGPNAVLCPLDATVIVNAGDMDDRVSGDAAQYGGPGNDQLSGNSLDGGPGDDVLEGTSMTGGPGRDRMTGTTGEDVFYAGDGDADRVSGGDGRDTLHYIGQGARRIEVDLGRGRASDGDRIDGVEDVIGTNGDDVLIGDGGPNRLEGRAGDDRVLGRGGADRIAADGGDDEIDAGPGDDAIDIRRGATVRCGTGTDRVALGGRVSVLHACERLGAFGVDFRVRRDRVRTSLRDLDYRKPCRFRITVGGTRVADGRTVRVKRPTDVAVVATGRCNGRKHDFNVEQKELFDPVRFRLL